jgi:pyruvate dehydrogenase E2 component (dihydrolipoamide acetyltransferase)
MAEIVRMPKLSDTMTEGVVARWHKKVGDRVKSGDLLAEIETDKATMEFESFQEGVLLYRGVEEGQAAPVDSILAILGQEGEDISAVLAQEPKDAPAAAPPAATPAPEISGVEGAAHAPAPEAPAAPADDGRIKASPLARRMAREKGIDLSALRGTGEGGRIVRRDVEAYVPGVAIAAHPPTPEGPAYEDVPLSQMRKAIARRLSESKFSAPHFYLTTDVDVDNLAEARERLNARFDVRISFNDLIIKAVAVALRRHPKVNASWLGDKIRYHRHINIGVAVAIEDGLVVPVITNAPARSLSDIAALVRDLAARARDRKLQPQEMEGNTFTISNLGMFGIEQFTAIINPPDVCILAVGAVREEPVVRHGAVVPGRRMRLTLSCDHRAVDGATGAAFLQTLRQLLEEPLALLL